MPSMVALTVAISTIVIFVLVISWRCATRNLSRKQFVRFADDKVDEASAGASAFHENDLMDHETVKTGGSYHEEAESAKTVRPNRNRLSLANQFSDGAVQAVKEQATPKAYVHSIHANDDYVWPARGGGASPMHVKWPGHE